MIWVAGAVMLKKMSARKGSGPVNFPFIQLMQSRDCIDKFHKALRCIRVLWNTDNEANHTIDTQAELKQRKRIKLEISLVWSPLKVSWEQ